MNNDNNKNPKANKLLTLYEEFEYQEIDFCGKFIHDK